MRRLFLIRNVNGAMPFRKIEAGKIHRLEWMSRSRTAGLLRSCILAHFRYFNSQTLEMADSRGSIE
ncbi:hypothetical protein KCP70_07300 [Salmonella enterica subsp. enterica]|nr:hypothetical protein KCP70_07300 [Salmonella enterica subsp. enterica]